MHHVLKRDTLRKGNGIDLLLHLTKYMLVIAEYRQRNEYREGLEIRRSLVRFPSSANSKPRIYSHCDRILSNLTADNFYDNDYVEKQAMCTL